MSDTFLRMMEGRLRDRLGQPLVIEPRLGGGGMAGAEATARAAPDGYTLLVNHIAPAAPARRCTNGPPWIRCAACRAWRRSPSCRTSWS